MKIIKNILCVLFGLIFLIFGLDKFFHFIPMPDFDEKAIKLFEAMATIKYLIPLVATIEILGGLLFIFPKTRALGAIIILPVMVGIFIHNIIHAASSSDLILPAVLLFINLWVIIDNKKKYMPMIS